MKNNYLYDVLILGGGISACVFASKYLKNNPSKKVALIEAGRGLGGRSSTRKSKRFKGWELNHGAPNFNICNTKNNLLIKSYIKELLVNKLIKKDESDFVYIDDQSNQESKKEDRFSSGISYLSLFTMSQLSQKIIDFNNSKYKIDFYFETLIFDLNFHNNEWTLISKKGDLFKSKFLICSSNLLSHKRSLKILNVNQIPIRKALPKNKDKIIDLLLDILDKQSFIPRLTFLIYTNENYTYKDLYFKKHRYFYLNKNLETKYQFERIVFQLQNNNKLGIVIHSKNIDIINSYKNSKNEEIFKQKIFSNFNELFKGNSSINQLTCKENMNIMH